MKKGFLFLTLLTSLVFGEDKTGYVGIGPYFQTQPVKNVDNEVMASPFFLFDNGYVYGRWTNFGAYFIGNKSKKLSWGMSVAIEPNVHGYKTDSIEKKNSWNGGLAFDMKNKFGYLNIKYMNDLLDNYNGSYGEISIGKSFQLYDNLSIDPQIKTTWHSKELNNYYFGLNESDISHSIEAYVMYDINHKFHIISNLKTEFLSSTLTSSSNIEDSNKYSGTVSLLYSFNY